MSADGDDLLAFAHARLDFWTAQSRAIEDPYVAAAAVLRGLYDIVDRIKSWEESRSSGVDLLAEVCRKLEATYATDLCDLALPHGVRPERQFARNIRAAVWWTCRRRPRSAPIAPSPINSKLSALAL